MGQSASPFNVNICDWKTNGCKTGIDFRFCNGKRSSKNNYQISFICWFRLFSLPKIAALADSYYFRYLDYSYIEAFRMFTLVTVNNEWLAEKDRRSKKQTKSTLR